MPYPNCEATEHNYQIARANYFKQFKDKRGSGLGTPAYDHSVTYSTLFCTKCAETREIVVTEAVDGD